jgi:hypothetical protein
MERDPDDGNGADGALRSRTVRISERGGSLFQVTVWLFFCKSRKTKDARQTERGRSRKTIKKGSRSGIDTFRRKGLELKVF